LAPNDAELLEPHLALGKLPANLTAQRVLSVHHWSDRTFSFRLTRDRAFRFENGQFVMIGLMVNGRPLMRAYSMATPNYEDCLEFLSIKVPNGPLTSRLQRIEPGDQVLVGRKPTGTLLAGNLLPGRNLYLLSSGTGLAPFMSLIRAPDIYDRFDRVVLTHTVRGVHDLAYRALICDELPAHEYMGELAAEKLLYYPTVTRGPFPTMGRITTLIENSGLFTDLDLPPLDHTQDRAMICGSEAVLRDTKALLERHGFREGSHTEPGEFVYEKAFAER
jgi:ferredoxin/flavodoxin---NADP+ reductase